ncbi:MAG TPA: hypothetical protein DCR35_04070, partial [Runella sp.]|nr:hypothetical protein [Runella sp.]
MCWGWMCSALAQKLPPIQYEDRTNEITIKTVAIYPAPNNIQDPARTTYSPVVNVESTNPLIVEFDDLKARYRTLRYRI